MYSSRINFEIEEVVMPIDSDKLKSETDAILNAISSPEFLAELEAIRQMPKAERLQAAAERLTPGAMRAKGMNIPDKARISSRYFEEGETFDVELGNPDGRIPVAPALNDLKPGILDELREKHPDVLEELLRRRKPTSPGGELDASICLCVGAGVCAGIGGGT